MGWSLFPKEGKFFDLFESSARNILKAAGELKEMIERFDRIEERARQLKETEHEGDHITHEIIKRVNTTFITPIDREDIHALASTLDDVLDAMEAVAARMMLYKVEGPTKLSQQFADVIVRSAEEVVNGVTKLRNLQGVFTHCVEMNRLENEADQILRDAYVELFANQTDPIKIIKWKDIYEHMEAATDRCEDVANILEGIAVKNA